MLALLGRLLRDAPESIRSDEVGAWWQQLRARRPGGLTPIDQAILAGFMADRVGFAFAGGYEAALCALFPMLPEGTIAAFCATEQGGNQPRAIATRLMPGAGGRRGTLHGAKRWSTMGPLATVLLVVVSEGMDEAGRNLLRLVRVDAASPGVTISTMPPTPFVPEVPHASIELAGVEVDEAALLPGDGYTRYVKPFRTVEDLHVHGAVLGYVISVARRHGFPQEATERLLASVIATRTLAGIDPGAAETHVALAGLLAQDSRLLEDLVPWWSGVHAPERARWERDRALFGSVAAQLRERRRQRAWETVAGVARPGEATTSRASRAAGPEPGVV